MIQDENHSLHVQGKVLEHMLGDESAPTDPLRFIIAHAPRFRYFSQHLPEDMGLIWDHADDDTPAGDAARTEIERRYTQFSNEIFSLLETLDPEAMTELTDAVEKADIDKASRILESHMEVRGRVVE